MTSHLVVFDDYFNMKINTGEEVSVYLSATLFTPNRLSPSDAVITQGKQLPSAHVQLVVRKSTSHEEAGGAFTVTDEESEHVTYDPGFVEQFVSGGGAIVFLRSLNEKECERLCNRYDAFAKQLEERKLSDSDVQHVRARLEQIDLMLFKLEVWYLDSGLAVPARVVNILAQIGKGPSGMFATSVTAQTGDGDKDKLINVQNKIILKQRNRLQLQGKPTKEEVRQRADSSRKKNGAINYSTLGKKLGVSNHTAKKWCQLHGIV